MDGLSSVDVLADVFVDVCFVEFYFLFLDVHLYIILYKFFDAKDFNFSRRFVLFLFGFVVGVSGGHRTL